MFFVADMPFISLSQTGYVVSNISQCGDTCADINQREALDNAMLPSNQEVEDSEEQKLLDGTT